MNETEIPKELPHPETLRLAIFSDSVPERNGAGAYYHDLKEQLSPQLEAIELFQPIGKHPLIRFALPLPGDSTQKIITPNVPRLIRQYKAFKPHLVVAVTPGPFGILGLILAKRSNAGFISAFHTHFEGLVKMYGDTLFFRFSAWYLEQTNKILLKRSASVLINNDDLIPTIKRLGARNYDIMGTPLASSMLTPPLVQPSLSLDRILFAGRLAPEKNLPSILEAARAMPGITFVMVGDGPLRKEMESAAQSIPNLTLTGWLDRDSLREEIDKCNLLILPSHMETFGTVALEALARGRPALVAESAGIHQWTLLKDAIFTLHHNESMIDALERIRSIPPVRWAEMAASGRRAAETLNQETIDQWAGFVRKYAKPVENA